MDDSGESFHIEEEKVLGKDLQKMTLEAGKKREWEELKAPCEV